MALTTEDRLAIADLVALQGHLFDEGELDRLGVAQNGTIGSVTYVDRVGRTASGWRIAHRQIHARRQPLNGRGSTSLPSQ